VPGNAATRETNTEKIVLFLSLPLRDSICILLRENEIINMKSDNENNCREIKSWMFKN
jgi:hypothetical protein